MIEDGRFELLKYGSAPLCKFSLHLLNYNFEIRRNDFGRRFVSGLFDPYSNNTIAPGHLLIRICQFALEIIFSELVDSEMRLQ